MFSKMDYEVTVIISSYNPGDYLADALESVFNQTYQGWKIILIDDDSTDNSLLKVQKYLEDPRVKLICNPQNLGQSKCQNIALQLVDTPYVICLDADDWFQANTLEVLLKEAKKCGKDVGVLCGNYLIIYEDSNRNIIKTKFKKGRSYKDCYDFLLSNNTLRPRFYRTDALRKVNGWPIDDPFEGRYGEDKNILCLLIEQYYFHWVDEVLYNYRRHGNNKTNNPKSYTIIKEWRARNALKRWGDKYEPIFKFDKNGWKIIVKLIPKDKPKNEKESKKRKKKQKNNLQ